MYCDNDCFFGETVLISGLPSYSQYFRYLNAEQSKACLLKDGNRRRRRELQGCGPSLERASFAAAVSCNTK